MGDTRVWHLYERLWKQPRLSLNDTQQRIAAVCDLRQEVAADGLDADATMQAYLDRHPEAF